MKKRARCTILLGLIVLIATAPGFAYRNSLNGVVIMLDPGHGGADSGAIGPSGLKESETNLRVARYLRMLLESDGANVVMTRIGDNTLSLQERVDKAKEIRPDLFGSIHHNASLKPTSENRGEIYFNALDKGVPLTLARFINNRLSKSNLVSRSKVIPGGFFVLRNNPSPAILTEGSFISHSMNEKALRTGKALTNEARVFHQAIRDVFKKSPLRVEAYSKEPVRVTTPFFKILLISNKIISSADLEMDGPARSTFRIEKVPMVGQVYSLSNSRPLPTGDYFLTFNFHSPDGSSSPQVNISVQVRHPIEKATLNPVAPYIPKGFRGAFPLQLTLKDNLGKLNPSVAEFSVQYDGKFFPGVTRQDGKACILLDLQGSELDSLKVSVFIGGKSVGTLKIPILDVSESFILGRVRSALTHEGVEKVKIQYGVDKEIFSSIGGYFFCELPYIFKNLFVKMVPPFGYSPANFWLRTEGNKISFHLVELQALPTALLDKKIGVFIDRASETRARFFTKELRKTGAKISRFSYLVEDETSLMAQVAKANRMKNLDLIFSIKEEGQNFISLRHYHKSKVAKTLGDRLATRMKKVKFRFKVNVEAGGDYELGHTGPPTIVLSFPKSASSGEVGEFVKETVEVLKSAF